MQSPSIPRISPLHLHPVDAFLALLLLSVAALHRLVVDPPRPIRPQVAADWKRQPQASAAPAVGIAPGSTVADLRRMARIRGLSQVGGRPIHKARRADLLASLGL